MISKLTSGNVPVYLWTPIHEVESAALTQLRNISNLPNVFHHVAVMPDVHFGKGATVGSVIAMKDAICPAAVGVDIGCGMGALRTSLVASDLPDNLHEIRSQLEANIPVGFSGHEHPHKLVKQSGLFEFFNTLPEKVQADEGKARKQCGTLGGGNHFIELCLDDGIYPGGDCGAEKCGEWFHQGGCVDEPSVWMVLHSGSRNIGKTLAEYHMAKAAVLGHNTKLPDRDLATFLAKTPEMEAYRRDLYWAQQYAFLNRVVMFDIYKNVLRGFFPDITFEEPILCHHNYVVEEVHFGENVFITRKGAIRAGKGELGVIPGSMGTKSYIVRGLGNEDSFNSASHGAGRRMSRGAAKRKFTVDDLVEQTEGVECRKDAGVLDELPGAYKDIETVMRNQADLVEIQHTLKQVLCVKG